MSAATLVQMLTEFAGEIGADYDDITRWLTQETVDSR